MRGRIAVLVVAGTLGVAAAEPSAPVAQHVAAVQNVPAAQSVAAVRWGTDLVAARAQAKSQNRLLLVDLYADWCGPCRRMDAEVWNRPDVVALTAKFVCVRVDADRARATLAYYDVHGLPSMLFLDPSDRVVRRAVGFQDAGEMSQLLRPLPDDLGAIDAAAQAAAANPGDEASRLRLADAYHDAGMSALGMQQDAALVDSKLLAADPATRKRVTTRLALAGAANGDWSRAGERLEACLAAYPHSPSRPALLAALLQVSSRTGARAEGDRRPRASRGRVSRRPPYRPGASVGGEGAVIARRSPSAKGARGSHA